MTQGEPLSFLGVGFKTDSQNCWNWLRKHGIALQELEISFDNAVDFTTHNIPFGQLRHLEDLIIEAPAATDDLLTNIILNNLNYLDVQECFKGEEITRTLDIATLEGIGTSLSALQTLDLTGVNDLSDDVLASIGPGCPWLESMMLRNSPYISDAGLEYIMMHNSFSSFRLGGGNYGDCNVTANAVIALLARGAMLQELDLDGVTIASDDVLVAIAGCPNLLNLKIYIGNETTGSGFVDIAANCSKLEDLNIYVQGGLTDVGLSRIAEGAFSALINVRLNIQTQGNELLTQSGVEHLVRSFKKAKLFAYQCYRSLGLDTSRIVNICTKLETLSLLVSDDALGDTDLAGISLPFLQTLELQNDHNDDENAYNQALTDAGLIAFTARHCVSLTSLDLGKFSALTNKSIGWLSKCCLALRSLRLGDVSNCTSDETLVHISKDCTALESITIWYDLGESQVTDMGIISLVHLADTHKLTSVQIKGSKARHPQLNYSPALRLAFPPSCALK